MIKKIKKILNNKYQKNKIHHKTKIKKQIHKKIKINNSKIPKTLKIPIINNNNNYKQIKIMINKTQINLKHKIMIKKHNNKIIIKQNKVKINKNNNKIPMKTFKIKVKTNKIQINLINNNKKKIQIKI